MHTRKRRSMTTLQLMTRYTAHLMSILIRPNLMSLASIYHTRRQLIVRARLMLTGRGRITSPIDSLEVLTKRCSVFICTTRQRNCWLSLGQVRGSLRYCSPMIVHSLFDNEYFDHMNLPLALTLLCPFYLRITILGQYLLPPHTAFSSKLSSFVIYTTWITATFTLSHVQQCSHPVSFFSASELEGFAYPKPT